MSYWRVNDKNKYVYQEYVLRTYGYASILIKHLC